MNTKFLILKAVYDKMPTFASEIIAVREGKFKLQIDKYLSQRTYKVTNNQYPYWFLSPWHVSVCELSAGTTWNGLLICEVDTAHQATTYHELIAYNEHYYNVCSARKPMFTQFKVRRYFSRYSKETLAGYYDFMHKWSTYYKLPFLWKYEDTQLTLSTM